MLPPLFLNVQPTDFVLDMCAAPGSKTKQLSEMLSENGLLVANEIDQKRIYTLTHNIKSGLGEYLTGNTVCICHGAQFLPDFKFNVDTMEKYFKDMISKSQIKHDKFSLR